MRIATVHAGATQIPSVRVQRQTTSGMIAMADRHRRADRHRLDAVVGRARASSATWSSCAATSRWRRCGTCWRAMPGIVSVGQQAFIGVAAYTMFVMAQLWGINPFMAVLLCADRPRRPGGADLRPAAPARRTLFRHRHLGDRRGDAARHVGVPLCQRRRRHEPARHDRLFRRTSAPSASRCSARCCCSSPSAAATGCCARATAWR